MGARKQRGLRRWATTLVLVVPLGVLASGCGKSDSEDASEGAGGTAGTGPTGGSGGTSGSGTQACEDFHAAPTTLAACSLVTTICPATLEEFLIDVTETGIFSGYSVVEADGLREIRAALYESAHAYSFDEDGMLVGWEMVLHSSFGPCGEFTYRHGRLLGAYHETGVGLHRCGLAPDALETGVLCDCPCPEPPPENAIYDAPVACLAFGDWPTRQSCPPTFPSTGGLASNRFAPVPMRTGCGVRTITLDELDCAYDDAGMLLGGERHRGDDLRDECPGVDAYRTGAPPVVCADETTCYFGSMPPAGSTPCPLE